MKQRRIRCHPAKLQRLIDTVIECGIPVVIPGPIEVAGGEKDRLYDIHGKMLLTAYQTERGYGMFVMLPSKRFNAKKLLENIGVSSPFFAEKKHGVLSIVHTPTEEARFMDGKKI